MKRNYHENLYCLNEWGFQCKNLIPIFTIMLDIVSNKINITVVKNAIIYRHDGKHVILIIIESVF